MIKGISVKKKIVKTKRKKGRKGKKAIRNSKNTIITTLYSLLADFEETDIQSGVKASIL